MDAQGQQTYQIVGEPDSRPRGEGGTDGATDADSTDDDGGDADTTGGAADIPDTDVEIVAQRTGASEDEAREALAETDGDLAAAVEKLE